MVVVRVGLVGDGVPAAVVDAAEAVAAVAGQPQVVLEQDGERAGMLAGRAGRPLVAEPAAVGERPAVEDVLEVPLARVCDDAGIERGGRKERDVHVVARVDNLLEPVAALAGNRAAPDGTAQR